MIILDTNVVSELVKPTGSSEIADWIDRYPAETLYLTTISLAELRFGVAALPDGRRKFQLAEALETHIASRYDKRILDFDEGATRHYARIQARARSIGKAIGAADGYIAAIAAQHGFAVATRDTSPFEAAGLTVINPWQAQLHASA